MKMLFLFTGEDPSSDEGHFKVLIRAVGPVQAKVILKKHLTQDFHRADLAKGIAKLKGEVIATGDAAGVVLSTVQSK